MEPGHAGRERAAVGRYAVAGLVLLLLALVGAVHLAASFVLGARASLLAAALAGLFALLWFVIPLVDRVRHRHRR